MDSLLANYASSDEEEHPNPPPSRPVFASLPKPKTSQPSTTISLDQEPENPPKSTSKLFSFLPPPKSDTPASKTRRVVQIRAPVNPFARKSAQIGDDDDDEEEEEKERKRRKESESSAEAPSVKSFLSSIPAPRNSASLGALPSSGSGRRAIVEADVPVSSSDTVEDQQPGADSYGSYVSCEQQADQNAGNYVDYAGNYGAYESGVGDQNSAGVDPSNYSNYQSYGNYGEYGHYRDNWADGSAAEVAAASDRAFRAPGRRGKNEVPTEIVEVKQDELMKNRPREDQAKLTGIAFGPSYQPASSKGKPSKLHKRKHQIGTLYFDMKQKETELAERRAKGFLTKAETQAKYGW